MICEALLEEIRIMPSNPAFWKVDDFVWKRCQLFRLFLLKGREAAAAAAAPSQGEWNPSLPGVVASRLSYFAELETTLDAVLGHAGAEFMFKDVTKETDFAGFFASTKTYNDDEADTEEKSEGKQRKTGGLLRGMRSKIRAVLVLSNKKKK